MSSRFALIAFAIACTALAMAIGFRGQPREPSPVSNAAVETMTHGPVDVGFCQDMATHHAQAILMSENVIGRASPSVRTVAIAILEGQAEETGLMRGWLTVWNAPQLSNAPMSWMQASGNAGAMPAMMTADGRMPGMASQAELARLGTARGTAVDVLFLQLMIRHHEAGIVMAEYAQAHARSDLVRGLAAGMAVDQANENVVMRRLLATYGASPLQ